MAWVVESVESCARCGERTPHRRRPLAPLRIAGGLLCLLAASLTPGLLALEGLAGGSRLALMALCLLVARGLWTSDAGRHRDLACARCRERALEAGRRLRRAPRTIDIV